MPYEDELTISIKSRDFKCPCGKTYLSYAALFTHIKQKHEGKVRSTSVSLQGRSPSLPLNMKSEVAPQSVLAQTSQTLKTSNLSTNLLPTQLILPKVSRSGQQGKGLLRSRWRRLFDCCWRCLKKSLTKPT